MTVGVSAVGWLQSTEFYEIFPQSPRFDTRSNVELQRKRPEANQLTTSLSLKRNHE